MTRPCSSASAGFTLIESLVAITVLMLSVAGPLYAANRSIVAAGIARDQLTASYLAQEAIEHVRLLRDNAYLAAYKLTPATASAAGWQAFKEGIEGECHDPLVCSVETAYPAGFGCSSASVYTCPSECAATCAPLLYSQFFFNPYNQESGVQTPFTRTLQVTEVSPTEELIVSTVTWSYRGSQYSVTATDHLTAWQ